MAKFCIGVGIGVLVFQVSVAGLYSSFVPTVPPVTGSGPLMVPPPPLRVEPPIAYIFPFTTAMPMPYLASCIGAFCVHVFSAGTVVEKAGLTSIRNEIVRNRASSRATTFLLVVYPQYIRLVPLLKRFYQDLLTKA